jgi:preprotein translocase subunit SecE
MGKLQKKKPASKKKKQTTDAEPKKNGAGEETEKKSPAISAPKKKPSVTARKPAPTAKTIPVSGIRGYYYKAVQFLREVKSELKKVTWPTRKQTIGSSIVVLIIVLFIALYLGIVDVFLSKIIHFVLQ